MPRPSPRNKAAWNRGLTPLTGCARKAAWNAPSAGSAGTG
jgi:hypothetical protein